MLSRFTRLLRYPRLLLRASRARAAVHTSGFKRALTPMVSPDWLSVMDSGLDLMHAAFALANPGHHTHEESQTPTSSAVVPPPQRHVLDVATSVGAELDRRHIPYAIAGGLALGLYGYTRFTKDVDIDVTQCKAGTGAFDAVAESFFALEAVPAAVIDGAHVPAKPPSSASQLCDYLRREWDDSQCAVVFVGGVRVDVFCGPDSLRDAAQKDAISVTLRGKAVRFHSLQNVLRFKLKSGFFRLKDQLDITEALNAPGRGARERADLIAGLEQWVQASPMSQTAITDRLAFLSKLANTPRPTTHKAVGPAGTADRK
jgi:hypothetical protein